MSQHAKPKLLFLRFSWPRIAPFLKRHLDEHVMCLSQYFDVTVITDRTCDYKQLCETHEPDIAMFESGSYVVGDRYVSNVSSFPTIPKVGFIHCDAFCHTRKLAISDMARYEISTYFSNSVSIGSYTPSIADQLFVWPNFVDPKLYRDYGFPKTIPILFTGSQASFYTWRCKIDRIVSQHYPSLHSPHFGWFWKTDSPSALSFFEGERYAQLINSAWVAPTCGTITNDVVRKHFEIPACNTCLLTQKTAALEAAGFVDQVNCIFADESDVLDKLEWLFQRPEELQRITNAGKQLVDSRHTIQQRDQVFQWYTLQKQLKPGQTIVQTGPFLPLKVVEDNAEAKNTHIMAGGIDRLLLEQADQEMRLGKYDVAEKRYRRCLNYVSKDYPEARFGLIPCWLHQGNFKAALASVRDHYPTFRLNDKKGFEPDPTEWAWFIIVLLCCGKNREAALRADQFAAVHNEELQRVRRVIRLLHKHTGRFEYEMSDRSHRASVLPPTTLAVDEWLANLVLMLEACGRKRTANMLKTVSAVFPLDSTQRTTKGRPTVAEKPAGRARDYRTQINAQRLSRATGGPFADAVLQYYLAAGGRFSRFVQKNKTRAQQVTQRIRGKLADGAPRIADHDWAAIVRLLTKEEIQSVVLVGAADGLWLSEAVLQGLRCNPNGPRAIFVNRDTPKFRKFHRRNVDVTDVEFRYLPDGALFEMPEDADIIAVNCPELLKGTLGAPTRARLILLDRINKEAGAELFQRMQLDEHYLLALHEPSHGDGYSIFRRTVVPAAGRNQVAA